MIFKTNQKYEQALLSTLLYIQTHLEQDLSLGVLAERVGFSAFHFHRIFRETIGEAVKEYIRRLRIERGAYRLKVSEQTILQIALDAGFKTHESFTRAFERQFGITPSEFRSNFLRISREHKKYVQPKYIADFNMQDQSGLLPNRSTCAQVRRIYLSRFTVIHTSKTTSASILRMLSAHRADRPGKTNQRTLTLSRRIKCLDLK